MSLAQLTEALVNFTKARDWDKYHSPKNFALALLVEAGELAAPFTWANDAESFTLCRDETQREKLASEVGDVMICLLQFAQLAGLDAEAAAWAKLAKLEKRYDPAAQKQAGGYVKRAEAGGSGEALPRTTAAGETA